jgi:sensor histidine kinase YesM
MKANWKQIYFICQLLGWGFFTLINLILAGTSDVKFKFQVFLITILGLTITHYSRKILLQYNWLNFKLIKLFPAFLFILFIQVLLHQILYLSIMLTVFGLSTNNDFWFDAITGLVNTALIYLLWNLIYFLVHFFTNYKKEEIKNLMYELNINETELNNLKSQLNPHFMFNALNSINALIDESPDKAKTAVLQLSNVLRSSLLINKQRLIALEKEINLVEDYLNLEKIRYEERLSFSIEIEPSMLQIQIPPLMLQTLTENAIKHGISTLTQGGEIKIMGRIQENMAVIAIINSGQLDESKSQTTKIGIKNTIQRLNLIFGQKASFSIENFNSTFVKSTISILLTNENNNHR